MKERALSDRASSALARALDMLFLENPLGTAIGIILGTAAHGLANAGAELYPAASTFVRSLKIWVWQALCVLPFAIRTYFRRPQVPPDVDMMLAQIRESRRAGNITQAQAHRMTEDLLRALLQRVVLRDEMQREMRELERIRDVNTPPSA
ncbi:MAG TPA: hypothetical protein VGF28_04355 [Thermoanaerobaculia bacterium]|jgi:hypothetical protein